MSDQIRASPDIRGGQTAADAALDAFDVARYAATRNQVLPESARGASRLSPYIRHGLLPLREVWNAVAGAAPNVSKLCDELLWQEYAQHLYGRVAMDLHRHLRLDVAWSGGVRARGFAARDELHLLGTLESGNGRQVGEPHSHVPRLAVFGAFRRRLGGWSGVFSSPPIRRFSRGEPARVAMDSWRRNRQTLRIRAVAGRETRASIMRFPLSIASARLKIFLQIWGCARCLNRVHGSLRTTTLHLPKVRPASSSALRRSRCCSPSNRSPMRIRRSSPVQRCRSSSFLTNPP